MSPGQPQVTSEVLAEGRQEALSCPPSTGVLGVLGPMTPPEEGPDGVPREGLGLGGTFRGEVVARRGVPRKGSGSKVGPISGVTREGARGVSRGEG